MYQVQGEIICNPELKLKAKNALQDAPAVKVLQGLSNRKLFSGSFGRLLLQELFFTFKILP